MSFHTTREHLLHLNQLLKKEQFDEAANVLLSTNVKEFISSTDFVALLVEIERTAGRLLKDCITNLNKNNGSSDRFIQQMNLFNQQIALFITDDSQQIQIQVQLLFDIDVLEILTSFTDSMHADDHLHQYDVVLLLCAWIESIAHFIHRHDHLDTQPLRPLYQSILTCVLSDWYEIYLKQSPPIRSVARIFFLRSCSFFTGVFQCSQLSFENALKTGQSYGVVIRVGERIFARHLSGFTRYLLESKDIEKDDSACLTGICLLITNCYNPEAFRDNDAYFTVLLRLLKCDFVQKGLLPTWANDSTILADTLIVQLKNASNDTTIRLYLQQTRAVDTIYPYMKATYDRLRLQACMLLGVLLDDAAMRQLQIPADELIGLYFDAIQQAHRLPNKCYKRLPIHLLLKALSALVYNVTIQNCFLGSSNHYFDSLILISDDYNIIYDILWTLSFEEKLHGSFSFHRTFLVRLRSLADRSKPTLDKGITRSAEGILWNLDSQRSTNSLTKKSEQIRADDNASGK